MRDSAADSMRDRASLLEFSANGYGRLLNEILKYGYRALPMTDWEQAKEGKVMYLRHDVDISTRMALRLGQIEAERGLRASYFFQLNTDTYHLLTSPNLEIVRRLRELGHCVGLHIDQSLAGNDEAAIDQTIRWFSETVTPIDPVVSFHRPTPQVVGKRYDLFLNAYDPRLFSEDTYCSDSRWNSSFYGKLMAWLAEGRTPLQLLTHPGWWGGHADADAIWHDIAARRQKELADYLLANFRKVFTGVVPNEDRNPGV